MADANDPVITKSMLDEALRESSRSVVDEIAGIIGDFSTRVDERFNKVEAGLHRVETRLDAVEASVADLNTKYDHLVTTLDRFLKRLDDKDQEDAAGTPTSNVWTAGSTRWPNVSRWSCGRPSSDRTKVRGYGSGVRLSSRSI
jgi:hypothetical protein